MISRKTTQTFFPNRNCGSKHDWNRSGLTIGGKIPFTGLLPTFLEEYMTKFVNQ
jgi:hypothetical protein